jgi:V8-like Glu-specific endopeptidase
MADRLLTFIGPRIVLIQAGRSVGTGAFIAPGTILTCAHVVRTAVAAGEDIVIQYATSVKDEKTREHTTKSVGIVLSELNEGKEYPDVAIIKIDHTEHPILQLPKPNEEFNYSSKREYLAIGYQKQDRHSGRNIPQTVSLNYEGEEDANRYRKIIFENGLVRPGMSGAPLVERESGQITGIVQMTRNKNDNIGAYTIPIESIWEEIRKISPEDYTLLNSRSHDRRVKQEYRAAYPRFPLLKKFGIRLLILPIILFFGIWWIFFHVGQIEESAVIAALLIILGVSGKLVSDWLGEDVQAEARKAKSGVGICFSSIWIYGDSNSANMAVTIQRDTTLKSGQTRIFDSKGKLRFLTSIIPFKDTLTLQPEGRVPVRIGISSFSKKELFYPKDFQLEPILILRFDPNYSLSNVMNKYVIQIEVEPSGQVYVDSTLQNLGSLIIGKRDIDISESKQGIGRTIQCYHKNDY